MSPLLFVLILSAPLLAADPPIQDLYSTEYFPAVHQEFQNARESIVVTMYQISLYPNSTVKSPTFALVRDLIDAHKRGVKVTVILNNPYRQHRRGEAASSKEARNITEQMLTAGGITVRHVSVRRVLHQKLIVIDGETVISGSHNWSDTALKNNIESSTLIRSTQYAAAKLKQISELKLLPLSAEALAQEDPPSISVPLIFLTAPHLAPNMMKESDHRAFNLYLLLLTQDPPISLNHTTTASALGMDNFATRTAYRQQISKTLRKLQDKYGLIKCTFHHGKNTDIKLLPIISAPRPSGERLGEGFIQIPLGYWEYGLSKKLSFSAKTAYLICLAEEAASPGKPWWTASGEALAAKYAGGLWSIRHGLRELEKMNLLEIVRSTLPPGQPYSRRSPNSYRLQPLLSPDAIKEQWKELADAYGSTNLKHARAQAERFDRNNSPAVVSELLRVADTYGWKLTDKAVGEVAKMVPDNPARHVGYIITLLRDWTQK